MKTYVFIGFRSFFHDFSELVLIGYFGFLYPLSEDMYLSFCGFGKASVFTCPSVLFPFEEF